ncbi:MAG: hypothetical protein HY063_15080 [Bacteroidetes bacterium]|nr:hypothetical protein [Bacteroidota bacterium]
MKKKTSGKEKNLTQMEMAEILVSVLGIEKTEKLLAFMKKRNLKSINFGELHEHILKRRKNSASSQT